MNASAKQKQRDDRARLAAAFASHLKPAEAKKAVVALFKVAPSTARHLIARGRFLEGSPELSPLMRAAGKSAKVIESWSDSKRQYAARVIGSSS